MQSPFDAPDVAFFKLSQADFFDIFEMSRMQPFETGIKKTPNGTSLPPRFFSVFTEESTR
jgi:hypothetical protein